MPAVQKTFRRSDRPTSLLASEAPGKPRNPRQRSLLLRRAQAPRLGTSPRVVRLSAGRHHPRSSASLLRSSRVPGLPLRRRRDPVCLRPELASPLLAFTSRTLPRLLRRASRPSAPDPGTSSFDDSSAHEPVGAIAGLSRSQRFGASHAGGAATVGRRLPAWGPLVPDSRGPSPTGSSTRSICPRDRHLPSFGASRVGSTAHPNHQATERR